MIIAGTGHRPSSCPCKYDEGHSWLLAVKNRIRAELLKDKPDIVISGMALGMDIWLAEIAIDLHIPVKAYVPFKGQEVNWPQKSQDRYNDILARVVELHYSEDKYSNYAFLKRDREMVDDCDHVYALYNTEVLSGGTYYTVNYAKEKGRSMTNFWV